MRLFSVKPDDVSWGKLFKYEINAAHKWGLPGVSCSVCESTWAMTGVDYPAIDLSSLPIINRYLDRKPVSVEELNALRLPVRPLLNSDAMTPPGTDFWPLVGKAWGKFGDFAWLNPWTMLMKRSTFETLDYNGVRLPKLGLKPDLKFRSNLYPDLVEPQIELLADLLTASFSPSESTNCPACGRNPHKIERFIVDGFSVPSHVDLFRAREHPTNILATEHFVDVVQKFDMADIIFSEIDVAI